MYTGIPSIKLSKTKEKMKKKKLRIIPKKTTCTRKKELYIKFETIDSNTP
jgi:hypothetical protein